MCYVHGPNLFKECKYYVLQIFTNKKEKDQRMGGGEGKAVKGDEKSS